MLALSACSTFQGHRQADITGDSPSEILWSTPGTTDLQSEVARLKAENEKLTKRVAELQKEAVPASAGETLRTTASGKSGGDGNPRSRSLRSSPKP